MAHQFTLTKRYEASPDELYSAWTDPDQYPVWSAAEPFTPGRCEMDVRVGGRYLLEVTAPGDAGTFTFSGEYTELVPGKRFACTTDMTAADGVKYMDACTCVADFIEVEPGVTEMTLVNGNIADAESAAMFKEGWETSGLVDLENFLAKRKANS